MITTVGNGIQSAKRVAGQGLQSVGSAIGSATISVKNAAGDAFNGAKSFVMGSPTQNSHLRGAAKGATNGVKAAATKTAATTASTTGTTAITLREASAAAPAAKTAQAAGGFKSLLTAKNAGVAGAGIGAVILAKMAYDKIIENKDKSKDKKEYATVEGMASGAAATAAALIHTGLQAASAANPIVAGASAISGLINGIVMSNDANIDEEKKDDGRKAVEAGVSGVATAAASGAATWGAGALASAVGLTGTAATAAAVGTAVLAPMALGGIAALTVKAISNALKGDDAPAPQPKDDDTVTPDDSNS